MTLLKRYYGYCYTCPNTGLSDYIGIGHETGKDELGQRMLSHLKSSHNRMLRQKLAALRDGGQKPVYAKIVENLTRPEITEWEATTIRKTGCLRNGTGPLFNVARYEKPWGCMAFNSEFDDIINLAKDDRCKVDYLTLADRICSGWNAQRAATELLGPLDAFGQIYPNAQDLHLDHRCIVPYATLLSRLTDGELPEIAASRPLEWVGAFGERFASIKALSEDSRCIVSQWSLYTEIKRGVEHEYAATNERFRYKFPRYEQLP